MPPLSETGMRLAAGGEASPEIPGRDEEDAGYSYVYLEDAREGDAVAAEVQFRLDGESALRDPAATAPTFTDSVRLASIVDGRGLEPTYRAHAYAPYDNCTAHEGASPASSRRTPRPAAPIPSATRSPTRSTPTSAPTTPPSSTAGSPTAASSRARTP